MIVLEHILLVAFSLQFFFWRLSCAAMSAMDTDALVAHMDAELDKHQSKRACGWCQLHFDAMEMKLHGKKYICKSCGSLNQMLYRHLGPGQDMFEGMSSDDVASFFQEASELPDHGDKGRWKIIRALYIEKQIIQLERTQKTRVTGEWLPMNVWVSRGWTEEQVKAYNDFEEGGPAGTLWRIPVKSTTSEAIRRSVEEQLMERERSLKKRRLQQPKGKAKALKTSETKEAVEEIPEEDTFFVPSDSDGDAPAPKKGIATGASKQKTPAQLKKEKEKEKAKAAKIWEKAVGKMNGLCAKTMPALQNMTSNLQLALTQIQKLGESNFPEDLRVGIQDAQATMSEWKAQATDLLHLFGTKKDKIKENHLGFDATSFSSSQKAAGELLTQYRSVAKALREKKASEAAKTGKARSKK